MIPFSFKLPEDIPGTYHMKQMGSDGREYDLQICYTVEVFLDTDLMTDDESVHQCFSRVHEFEIREFLFTNDEVAEDVGAQQLNNKVKTMFKTQPVLQPMFSGTGRDKALNDKLK